jgi:putative transposase
MKPSGSNGLHVVACPRQSPSTTDRSVISNALDRWAYDRGLKFHFIRPGSRLRTRLSSRSTAGCEKSVSTPTGFDSLEHARELIAAWWTDYNTDRPHSALGGLTPMEYEEQLGRTQLVA